MMYIILFPKLIAGPIIRYHDFAGQIHNHTGNETFENRLNGLYRFFIGLGKKVLIANVMGAAADEIFAIPQDQLGTITAWLGALSYTFQIYFDFSGYSDMAIGLGLMMGFHFPENFDNPYTAQSVTDFWRRWHITLGNWMRNYLYIPMGGNRVSKTRLYFNLWLVFIFSGLWHGAAWAFIFWGAYHGLFLVLERIFLEKWLEKAGKAAVLYTFPAITIGWVFFRMEHMKAALKYVAHMFTWHAENDAWQTDHEYIFIFCIAAFFSFFTLSERGKKIQHQIFHATHRMRTHYLLAFVTMLLMIISVARITTASFNPFIYFRF